MEKEKMYEVKMYENAPWLLAKGQLLGNEGGLAYELIAEPERKGITTLFREVLEGTTFTCPECGSHAFGSSGIGDGDAMRGHCHGRVVTKRFTGRHQTHPTEPCSFTWPRNEEEDAKVFKGNGHYSPAIYEAVVVKQA